MKGFPKFSCCLLVLLIVILATSYKVAGCPKGVDCDKDEGETDWPQYGEGIDSKSDLVNNGDPGKVVKALGDGNIKTKDIPAKRTPEVVPHMGEKQVGKLQPNQVKKGNWNKQGMTEKVRGLGDKVQHIPPDQASPELVNAMEDGQLEHLDDKQWQNAMEESDQIENLQEGDDEAVRQGLAHQGLNGFDDLYMSDRPTYYEDGILDFQGPNTTVQADTFDHGEYTFTDHGTTLQINNNNFTGGNNIQLINHTIYAETIQEGTADYSSGTADFTQASDAYFGEENYTLETADSVTIDGANTYYADNVTNITVTEENMHIESAETVTLGDTLLGSQVTNATVPFTFNHSLFNFSFTIDEYDRLEAEHAEVISLDERLYHNVSDATILFNQSIIYANMTSGKDTAEYAFDNPRDATDAAIRLDRGEEAIYAQHNDSLFFETPDTAEAILGEGDTLHTSTRPIATHHIDPVMVLLPANGTIKLYDTTQFIGQSDTASLFANTSGAYVRMDNTHKLYPGNLTAHSRTLGNISLALFDTSEGQTELPWGTVRYNDSRIHLGNRSFPINTATRYYYITDQGSIMPAQPLEIVEHNGRPVLRKEGLIYKRS